MYQDLSQGSNVIPRRARSGLAGLGPQSVQAVCDSLLRVALQPKRSDQLPRDEEDPVEHREDVEHLERLPPPARVSAPSRRRSLSIVTLGDGDDWRASQASQPIVRRSSLASLVSL